MAYYLEHSDSWFGYDRAEHKDICIAPEGLYCLEKHKYLKIDDKQEMNK